MKNKIGWCDMTWNPVWGCLNHCEYCYAKKMAKRFAKRMAIQEYDPYHNIGCYVKINMLKDELKKFIPTFLYSQFNKKFPKKPQRIFVGSMSEIYYWESKWMNKVIFKIFEYPQHTFQFLTKYPCVYRKYVFPENCWLGITVTDNKEACYSDFRVAPENMGLIKFVSIEPILGEIEPESLYHLKINWVIIGAESGNRKGKIIPKKEWVENIVNYCKSNKIPIYLKDSLKDIYPVEIKEFPI